MEALLRNSETSRRGTGDNDPGAAQAVSANKDRSVKERVHFVLRLCATSCSLCSG